VKRPYWRGKRGPCQQLFVLKMGAMFFYPIKITTAASGEGRMRLEIKKE
jgi:hypothetical protein